MSIFDLFPIFWFFRTKEDEQPGLKWKSAGGWKMRKRKAHFNLLLIPLSSPPMSNCRTDYVHPPSKQSKIIYNVSTFFLRPRCIKPCLNISSVDTILAFCCRFDILECFGWCWISKHICSRGFFEFINFNFYATTKSWHAHQKVRLDELVWKKCVPDIFMETFIELSIKPFEHLF